MKKGTKHSKESRDKIIIARKRQGSNVWNKGLKYSKYGDEKPCKVLRRNKNYYLSELEKNAKRAKKLGYHDTLERREQIKKLMIKGQLETGAGSPPREWTTSEIDYLKENFKNKTFEEIAIHLDRSWSSIAHKVSRLKLRKYNKWNG